MHVGHQNRKVVRQQPSVRVQISNRDNVFIHQASVIETFRNITHFSEGLKSNSTNFTRKIFSNVKIIYASYFRSKVVTA